MPGKLYGAAFEIANELHASGANEMEKGAWTAAEMADAKIVRLKTLVKVVARGKENAS